MWAASRSADRLWSLQPDHAEFRPADLAFTESHGVIAAMKAKTGS
jgi:hypothetical protein